MGEVMYLILCFFLFNLSFYLFQRIAKQQGWQTRNYSGALIPAGYGIVLFFFLLFYESLYYQQLTTTETAMVFYTALLIIVGWIDDRYGNPSIKGIKGHLAYLLHTGRISTGCVKAAFGVGAGVGLSLQLTNSPLKLFLYSGVLSLSTNFINLLDVRPGRALKGFSLFFPFIYLMAPPFSHLTMYANYFIAFFLAALPYDLKGAMMLGDSGANGLGFSLGSFLILTLSIQWLWVYFLFLLAIHWYAEKSSISTFIKKHTLLRRVDEWGRSVDP